MIRSFRHKGLSRLYAKADRRGVPGELVAKCERLLARLDVVTTPEMMNLPGLRLHPLKGQLKGFWSVWVSGIGESSFGFKKATSLMWIWSITIEG